MTRAHSTSTCLTISTRTLTHTLDRHVSQSRPPHTVHIQSIIIPAFVDAINSESSMTRMFCSTSCANIHCAGTTWTYMYISSDGPSFLLSQKRSPIPRTFEQVPVGRSPPCFLINPHTVEHSHPVHHHKTHHLAQSRKWTPVG